MKSAIRRTLSAVLLLAAAVAHTGEQRRSWEDQSRAMLYLISHLSSINAINGLNLTREQAVSLRTEARRVAAVCPPPPGLDGEFRPDLQGVRDTYVTLGRELVAGRDVDASLEARVTQARSIEAAVVRMSLTRPITRSGNCRECHREPGAERVDPSADLHRPVAYAPKTRAEHGQVFMAHLNGIFGRRGVIEIVGVAPTIDRLLTASQKAAVADFSCCLVPPKSMSDPVRAGQASGSERPVELLRAARQIPEPRWPAAKTAILDRLEGFAAAGRPDIEARDRQDMRRVVEKLLQRARRLSPTDFEMEKDKLAAELTERARPQTQLPPKLRSYMTASFLLLPGAVEVYDRLIGSSGKKVGTPP